MTIVVRLGCFDRLSMTIVVRPGCFDRLSMTVFIYCHSWHFLYYRHSGLDPESRQDKEAMFDLDSGSRPE